MKTAFCLSDPVVFPATYRTEKWGHPFGLKHPLWSLVSGPEWVGQACGTGQWRDTWPGPTGCGPAHHRWQRSQCHLPSLHWRKPCHHPSLRKYDDKNKEITYLLNACVCLRFYHTPYCCLTWLGVTVVYSIPVQLKKLLRFRFFFSVAAHCKCVLTHLQSRDGHSRINSFIEFCTEIKNIAWDVTI